jgi:hypothetical protein
MTLTVIDSLQKESQFAKDSQIPNIALMLALLIKYTWTTHASFGGWDDEIAWIFTVVKQAEDANITLSGPAKFDEILEEIKDNTPEKTATSRNKPTKGAFSKKVCWLVASCYCWSAQMKLTLFALQFASYGSRGGDEFDIAKMPAAERKKYSLGGRGSKSMF